MPLFVITEVRYIGERFIVFSHFGGMCVLVIGGFAVFTFSFHFFGRNSYRASDGVSR